MSLHNGKNYDITVVLQTNQAANQIMCCIVFLQHHLYRSLGLNLSLCDPPEAQRLQILSEVINLFYHLVQMLFKLKCIAGKESHSPLEGVSCHIRVIDLVSHPHVTITPLHGLRHVLTCKNSFWRHMHFYKQEVRLVWPASIT